MNNFYTQLLSMWMSAYVKWLGLTENVFQYLSTVYIGDGNEIRIQIEITHGKTFLFLCVLGKCGIRFGDYRLLSNLFLLFAPAIFNQNTDTPSNDDSTNVISLNRCHASTPHSETKTNKVLNVTRGWFVYHGNYEHMNSSPKWFNVII